MPLNVSTNGGIPATTNFSPNEYELLADYTVSESATTSYTLSGLNINADEEVVLVMDIKNLGTNNIVQLFVNGNNTQTNYYNQYISVSGTSITANRGNYSWFIYSNAGLFSTQTNIKLTNNGYFTVQNQETAYYGSSNIGILYTVHTSTFALSQISYLTISGSVSNAIDIGSRFQLYKVKGQVQQTWATT